MFLFVVEKFEVSGKTCFVFMGCAHVVLLATLLPDSHHRSGLFLIQGFAWSDFLFEPFKFGRPAASVRSWLVGVTCVGCHYTFALPDL